MTSGDSLALSSSRPTQAEGATSGTGPASLLVRIQTVLQNRLVETITVSLLLSLALTGTSAWNLWRIYQGLQTTVAKQFKLEELSGQIIHLDEVLTMSARMNASTGDTKWEQRYIKYVPQLDAAIESVLQNIPVSEQASPEQTDAANKKLVAFETQSFELVRKGQAPAALKLLLGPEYEAQKKIYGVGINTTLNSVKQKVDVELKAYQQSLSWSVAFAVGSAILLALSWYVVLMAVTGYIRDRKAAQAALQSSQDNLLDINQQLEGEVQQRARQEQQIREESDLLQADVAHILDIVSALEEGDLTIEAEVNERATGLVSDTLNRLIESLNRIVSVVVSTAQEVASSAGDLEQMAVETAQQAQAQTQAVQDVQGLMSSVNALTALSRKQALAADEAVQMAQQAVSTGQREMTGMVSGIATLQQGTDQIVKRTQLLSDFVELASQFSKDQKRVASLTRVLALNASTLSSRAIKEQDPEQFASIAHEFEAVARQVNDLAAETNQSLVLLQQRTDQIQTVTSGLSHDVMDINQLVQDFTQGVNQSKQVFANIQSVTEQVAEVGQQVNQSSYDIVEVVQNTLVATRAIATVAEETETKAAVTRQQVESMKNLAQTLLQMVEFFRINSVNSATPNPALAPEAQLVLQSAARS